MREKTCCFTGHRQIPSGAQAEITDKLERVITDLYQKGIRYYGAGGALGFDTLAAQAVIRLRGSCPGMKLILVLPCLTQTRGWRPEDIAEYECSPPPLSHYGYISNIGFINEERLLIGGRLFNDAPLVFTADGGNTWTEIQTPNSIAECKAIAMKNNMITIIFNSGDIMRSRDLGDTWETVWSTQQ